MMLSDVLQDSRIGRLVELALMEDIGLGDLTSDAILPDTQLGRGQFICKQDGVIAGLDVAALVFRYCDHSITLSPVLADGQRVSSGEVIATVDGLLKSILKGERTALNFLQRMSGIATMTRAYVDAIAGTHATITDTRKTVPGLRVLDKLAVKTGGGTNHRFGLDDMILIKDNHIVAAGSLRTAVERCVRYTEEHNVNTSIEVETTDLNEVREALMCKGIRRIMLDNFSIEDMRRAVEMIDHAVEVEASGGITLGNVRRYAETGVDFISIGALTHSVQALDISLELTPARLHGAN
jgi:nicotinate-nucleotide pyrophosphorylase (carboxylating)